MQPWNHSPIQSVHSIHLIYPSGAGISIDTRKHRNSSSRTLYGVECQRQIHEGELGQTGNNHQFQQCISGNALSISPWPMIWVDSIFSHNVQPYVTHHDIKSIWIGGSSDILISSILVYSRWWDILASSLHLESPLPLLLIFSLAVGSTFLSLYLASSAWTFLIASLSDQYVKKWPHPPPNYCNISQSLNSQLWTQWNTEAPILE